MDDVLSTETSDELSTIKLFVTDDLYRAFSRCMWVLMNEEDRTQLDIMEEVVRDYLVKNGC
jgi:hypothetical protein